MTRIIGIAGLAGAGKDSIAKHLIAEFGYEKEAFARRLKEFCANIFGWQVDRLEDLEYKQAPSGVPPFGERSLTGDYARALIVYEFKSTNFAWRSADVEHVRDVLCSTNPEMTRRQILQLVGTEGFRAVDADHWIKRGMKDALSRPRVVFTDVRFQNEANAIRAAGGTILGVTKLNGALTGTQDLHQSELEVFRVIETADLSIGIKKGRMDLVEWFALAYGQLQENQ